MALQGDIAESRCYTNALDARTLANQLKADALEAAGRADEARERYEAAERLANRARVEYDTRYGDLAVPV